MKPIPFAPGNVPQRPRASDARSPEAQRRLGARLAGMVCSALVVAATGAPAQPVGERGAASRAEQAGQAAAASRTPELTRFYSISKAMSGAYYRDDLDAAGELAREYLLLAPRFPRDWNYGNAIHNANAVLGLIALRQGRRSDALAHLAAAGSTPGSPQLNTFGPWLLLAREVAQLGEYGAAASYLRSIQRFWKAKDMSPLGLVFPHLADPDPISTWIKQLESGKVPDFGAPFNMTLS